MVGGLEGAHEGEHCGFLCRCTGVCGCLAVSGKSTDIADADSSGIMPFAVRSNPVYWSGLLDRAVDTDNVVVADTVEAALAVPAVDVGSRIVASFGGGGAMDDYLVDSAHKGETPPPPSKRGLDGCGCQ